MLTKPVFVGSVALSTLLLSACSGQLSDTPPYSEHDAVIADLDAAYEPGADADVDAAVVAEDAPLPATSDAHVPPFTGMPSVFFSGHSLINVNTPTFFQQLSARDGRAVNIQLQMGVGSPMSIRLGCPRGGQEADGTPVSYSLMDELQRPNGYNTLILTERHDIVTTVLYEHSTAMARRFRDAFRTGNPTGRAFLFESWFTIDTANPSAFRTRQERELVVWQCVASKVNESRGEFAPMLVVPAGQAVSELVGDVLAGRAAGLTSLRDVFLDNVHLTNVGNYLIALIHYGVVHQRSPVGLPSTGLVPIADAPPSMTPATAAYLQNLAARYVERTFAEAAASQRSDADCVAAIQAPCRALMSSCSGMTAAFRNDTAPVPVQTGSWCLR